MSENAITVFEHPQFGEVRTVEIDGEPWFVAADVCRALDLSNPTMALGRLDEDERSKFNLGRQGEASVVSEPGQAQAGTHEEGRGESQRTRRRHQTLCDLRG